MLKIKKIWHDSVWSKVIAGLIVAAILAFIGYTKNWIGLKPIDTSKKSNISTNYTDNVKPTAIPNESTILTTGELPYLENLPILDHTLFLRYNYNNFVFGGKNLKKIVIAARSKEGN